MTYGWVDQTYSHGIDHLSSDVILTVLVYTYDMSQEFSRSYFPINIWDMSRILYRDLVRTINNLKKQSMFDLSIFMIFIFMISWILGPFLIQHRVFEKTVENHENKEWRLVCTKTCGVVTRIHTLKIMHAKFDDDISCIPVVTVIGA